MTDTNSYTAIIAHHREAFEAKQENFRLAVCHLDKVLNGCRNAAEQQAVDTAAREWLKSIGN